MTRWPWRRIVLAGVGVGALTLGAVTAQEVQPGPPAIGISLAAGSLAAPSGARTSQATPRCIAIVLPGVQGIEGSATDVGSALRELFASYLKGPSTQVLELEARLVSQALEEARQKECRHVLIATLTRKRGGGGVLGKVMGHAAATAAWHIPGGGTVGSAVARGAAIGTVQAVAGLATSTRAKDEMRLEYRLASVDGKTQVGPKSDRRKAKVDGEDLLTPLVERAAETIVGAMAKS